MCKIYVSGTELNHLTHNGEKLDFIGDIHGCYKTLCALLVKLGYQMKKDLWIHPEGRIPVFLGDLIDRGPDSHAVLALVMRMVKKGKAKYVIGNHCFKLYKFFKGGSVKVSDTLAETIKQIRKCKGYEQTVQDFVEVVGKSPTHLVLDGGNVIAVHASISEDLIDVHTKKAKDLNMYGYVERDESEEEEIPPKQVPTSEIYNGSALVVHGHIQVDEPIFSNNVLNIDTGCGEPGGNLTAYRYPEGMIVSVRVTDFKENIA